MKTHMETCQVYRIQGCIKVMPSSTSIELLWIAQTGARCYSKGGPGLIATSKLTLTAPRGRNAEGYWGLPSPNWFLTTFFIFFRVEWISIRNRIIMNLLVSNQPNYNTIVLNETSINFIIFQKDWLYMFADLHSQKYFSAFKNKNTFFLKQLTNYSFLTFKDSSNK